MVCVVVITSTRLLLSGSQVNHNGILSFQLPFTEFVPRPFPISDSPLIAPLWDDVNFGNIFYRVTSNVTLLQRACDQLQELFPSSGNFTPTILFIATWDRVTQQSGVGAQVHMPIVCLLLTGRSSIMCPCYYSSAVESHLSKGPKYDVNYIPRYKLKN